MSLLVVGLNHRTATSDLLQRAAVPSDDRGKALDEVAALEHVIEAAVLSTCNRVEVYAHTGRFHAGLEQILSWLAARAGVDVDTLASNAYSHFDDRAAAHLFAVASGLDSVIVGERQIALQVKQATVAACEAGASRRVLGRLFERAISVSRRVRSETAIMNGASSMVDVGLDVAARTLGGALAGRDVLIVGAGKIGGLAAARLRSEEVGEVLVRNRSPERSERLAGRVGGTVVGDGELGPALGTVDLVVCCTGASMPILDRELVVAATRSRGARSPLVLLDLGMPPNVDPACADIDGVQIIDLDDGRAEADQRAELDAVDEARAIIEEEAARFRAWTHAVKVEPTIRALRERGEEVRRTELERLSSRLADLDGRERDAVEALTRGILNTLLHEPTVRLKELADGGGAEHYANALRDLFDLDE
jgi:glutamyl-tRNA reductase